MKTLAFAAIAAAAIVVACVTPPASEENAVERGRALAERHCRSCHATGAHDESLAPEAPAFRHLSRNYRVDSLEEALAEGISVGHPAMPQFEFAPDDVDALIAYLQSVQETP